MYDAEYGLEGLIEFKWKNFEVGKQVLLLAISFLIFYFSSLLLEYFLTMVNSNLAG